MLRKLIQPYSQFSYETLLKLSLSENPHYYYLLDDNSRSILKYIKSEFHFNADEAYNVLKEWMIKHKHLPPLEFIYWLHSENILLITTYFCTNKKYCEYFYKVFEDIYTNELDNSEKQIYTMMSNILTVLINTLKHHDDELQIFMEEIADCLIVKMVVLMENNLLKRSPILDIKKCSEIYENNIKYFALLYFNYLLSYTSKYSKTMAIEMHTKLWTSISLSTLIKEHINAILITIPVQIIMDKIQEKLSEKDFCWKYLFIIISVLIKANSENAVIVKGAVDVLLKEAFDEDSIDRLYAPVLIARHCCYEKARYFLSYANWFSTLNFKNSKSFILFINFLTEILPYEPPLYLKIHLNKVPSAPHGCQNLLVEYIVLAKTRLADLNESGEYIGLFSDYHETDHEGQQADIARVINYFIENNEIPKPLLEAYVLRRQYYEKVFLKQLLKIPEREDTNRGKLIKKLYSLGKISTTLYNSWAKL